MDFDALDWITSRRNHGQICTVSYAWDGEKLYRRTSDASDRSVSYEVAYVPDDVDARAIDLYLTDDDVRLWDWEGVATVTEKHPRAVRVWTGPYVGSVAERLRSVLHEVAEGTEHVYVRVPTFDAARDAFEDAGLTAPTARDMSSCAWVWP